MALGCFEHYKIDYNDEFALFCGTEQSEKRVTRQKLNSASPSLIYGIGCATGGATMKGGLLSMS